MINIKKMVFTHCGSDHFDKTKFQPIQNTDFIFKPDGGLWSSPSDPKYLRWLDWCAHESFRYSYYSTKRFNFKLKPDAKILVIKKQKQLNKLPTRSTKFDFLPFKAVDYEKLNEQYDGMLVLNTQTFDYFTNCFQTWDCDTLLVFNPEIIEEV